MLYVKIWKSTTMTYDKVARIVYKLRLTYDSAYPIVLDAVKNTANYQLAEEYLIANYPEGLI